MRVFFVGTNPGGGGTESHFISLARALADSGHDVAAAVRPDDFIHRGLAVDSRIRLFAAQFRNRRDLLTIRELSQVARALRPDWIVGAFKAEYTGLAVVAKAADARLVLLSHLDQRIRPLMLNPITRLVRGVIVPSKYLRVRAIERGLPASRVAVLANPVDVDHFKPDPALRARTRQMLGLGPRDVLVGYAGRFESAKGVQTLARAVNVAMGKLDGLHALWVGHGRSEHALREIATLGGFTMRHHWKPWMEDILPAYAAMDMLALASEGSESFGRVLVEAQSCGVAVLGARNGGIPEALIDGETGRLIAPGNINGWAKAIVELARDSDLRTSLGASGRRFALGFESHRVAADFLRVLESFDAQAAPTPRSRDVPVRLARSIAVD